MSIGPGTNAARRIERRIYAWRLSGLDIGRYILDTNKKPWRIAQICHFVGGVVVEIHHPDRVAWATSEPTDEVEYGRNDFVTIAWERAS